MLAEVDAIYVYILCCHEHQPLYLCTTYTGRDWDSECCPLLFYFLCTIILLLIQQLVRLSLTLLSWQSGQI